MRAASLLLCLALLGCGDDHGHAGHDHVHGDEGHGHEHAEDAIGITRWSESLELFAEHSPAVAGEEIEFLAHLTNLGDFSPVEDARVRLTLSGPAELSAEAGMLRSGIYRPTLTATTPGTYDGAVIVLGDPERRVDGFTITVHASDADVPAAEDETPGRIGFLKEQQWRVPFGTEFAALGSVRATREVTGVLTTPPGGSAHVHAPVDGRVMAPTRGAFPAPGDRVEAGQLLATMAPTPGAPEDAARASLTVVEAEARVEEARAELERSERMLADQAIPQRRVTEAQRQLRVAEASLAAARRLRSVYSAASSGRGGGSWRIVSPIAGVVDSVDVSPGEAVRPDEEIFRVVDPTVIWVRADVPETWAARFVRDADASFQVVGDERWRPLRVSGDDPSASIAYVARSVDDDSRTVRVIYALREPDDALRVGAAVRVAIPAGEPERGVVVPRAAIDDVQGHSVIYVQVEGESFEERVVRLGPRAGDRVLVREGVREGERIVTLGAHLVHLASGGGEQVGHAHPH